MKKKLVVVWEGLDNTKRLVILTVLALGLGTLIGLPFAPFIKASQQKPVRTNPAAIVDLDTLTSGRPAIGQGQEIILIEDFMCAGCQRFTQREWPDLFNAAQNNEVKLVFVPLSGHEQGIKRAAAAQCVFDMNPNEFWRYKEILFDEQRNFTLDLTDLAPVSDKEALSTCMDNRGTLLANDNYDLAKKLGVTVTPSFIIGNWIHQTPSAEKLLTAAIPFANTP